MSPSSHNYHIAYHQFSQYVYKIIVSPLRPPNPVHACIISAINNQLQLTPNFHLNNPLIDNITTILSFIFYQSSSSCSVASPCSYESIPSSSASRPKDWMEPDSAGNENFSFDDLDIDYEFIGQLLHGDTVEAFANEITTNISNELRDLAVLGANLPPPVEENRAASTNTDLLDSVEENVQNLAQPAGSLSFGPPSITAQQIYPPIMQLENQSLAAGKKDLLNASTSILGNEDAISTNISAHLVANSTTLPLPSFGTPVMGRPKPYHPIRPQTLQTSGNLHLQPLNSEGHLESEILSGRESFLAHGNSNQENLLYSTNVGQTMGSSFSSMAPTLPAAYPPTTVGLIQQHGPVQSTFSSQHDGNWMNMNAPNAQLQNPFQIDFVSPQWMAPVCVDPLAQNMASNSAIRSNFQQAPIYASQYPQTITRIGVVNGRASHWMNRQQPNWIPINNCSPYRSLPPSGPQCNQFMTPNIIHPRSANSMLQVPSMPLRRTLFNEMPVQDQIPGMSNIYDPNYNDSVLSGHSMQPCAQQFPNHNYQNHMVSNVYNPLEFNTNLPGPSSLPLRMPYPSHGTHGVLNFLYPNSSLLGPNSGLPSTSMTQPLHHRHCQPIQGMPSLLDLLTYHPTTQIPSPQGQIHNASVTPGVAEPRPVNSVPPRSNSSNSPWQQSEEALNTTRRNGKNPILDTFQEGLLNADMNQQNATATAGPSRRRSPPESEDTESSSSSSKRSKGKKAFTTQKEALIFHFPADEGTSNAANAPKPRVFKNSGVYDPSFEKAGLWPDPHLRMFVLNWL